MSAGKGGRTGHWDQFEANRKMFQVGKHPASHLAGSSALLADQLLPNSTFNLVLYARDAIQPATMAKGGYCFCR